MELDFSSQSHFLLALLPDIVLTVFGMIVLIAGVWNKEEDGQANAGNLGVLALVGIL